MLQAVELCQLASESISISLSEETMAVLLSIGPAFKDTRQGGGNFCLDAGRAFQAVAQVLLEHGSDPRTKASPAAAMCYNVLPTVRARERERTVTGSFPMTWPATTRRELRWRPGQGEVSGIHQTSPP